MSKGTYLSPQMVSNLRRAGVSQNEINQYLTGGASSEVKRKINTILNAPSPAMATIGPTVAESETFSRQSAQKAAPKQSSSPAYNDWGAAAVREAQQPRYDPGTRKTTPGIPSAAPKRKLPTIPAGAYGRTYDIPSEGFRGSVDPNTGQARKPSGPVRTYPIDSAGQSAAAEQGITFPEQEALNPYPTLPAFVQPTITQHDFTDQARGVVDPIFAPIFNALNQSKTNIGTQGENSRKIVGGLYENMVKDIATQAQANAAQYDQSAQKSANTGAQLKEQIGQNYQGANQTAAALMKHLGQEAAAPELLQQGANEQAWQQGQAADNTAAMQDYYGQQKQGQATHDTTLGQITQNQGAVAQQDILAEVQNALAGVDKDIANTESQKAQTALDMANQLTDRDLSLQQANAGYSMQGQQFQRDAALDAWRAANDAIQYKNTGAQQDWENRRQATLDQNQLDIDQQTLAAKTGAAAGGLTPDQTKGVENARQNLISRFGEQMGSDMFNVAQLIVAQAPDKNDPAYLSKLYQQVQQYSQQHPESPFDQLLSSVMQVSSAFYGT